MDNNNPDLEKAKSLVEECEYDEAEKILKRLFKKDPNNVEILDLLGEIYVNIGNIKGSKKMLEKSISLSPDSNPDKYMDYAQVLDDPYQRVESYKKAIELYKKKLNKGSLDDSKQNETKEFIASALSSIVSLYMTTDLCDEPDAEQICEKSVEEALKICPESFEALLQFSNLRIIRKRDKEAKEALYKILEKIKKMEGGESDEQFPERDMMINLSQNFAELKMFKEASYVMHKLIEKNDEDLELFYLLAVYQENNRNFFSAMEALEKFNNIYIKLQKETVMKNDEIVNPMIQQYVDSAKSMYTRLSKMKKEQMIDEHPDEDNDDFEEIDDDKDEEDNDDVEMK